MRHNSTFVFVFTHGHSVTVVHHDELLDSLLIEHIVQGIDHRWCHLIYTYQLTKIVMHLKLLAAHLAG